jgi:hypothetical protein
MSAGSRAKSQAGEREVAALIRDLTGWQVRRCARQHESGSGFEGVPGWLVEVRRPADVGRADIARWWLQTGARARQAVKLPVLFYRADRDEWRAVWPLAAHLRTQTIDRWSDYAWAVEGSPKAWAAAAQEFALPGNAKTVQNERRG